MAKFYTELDNHLRQFITDQKVFFTATASNYGRINLSPKGIDSAQTSCGFGVPIFEFKEERETLKEWANKKGEQGIFDYWREKNQTSIDGLPTRILENH